MRKQGTVQLEKQLPVPRRSIATKPVEQVVGGLVHAIIL
jgi:hypothetical protein